MGQVITNLKARFGIDTTDFKKGLKDGDKAVDDFKSSAGSALDEFASMFGINMSAVNDSLSTANKSLNFLGQSFKAAAVGGNILTIAMKALKVALIATGVGALVVALGSLVSYFKRSGEGADKFAKMLAQVKSVVNNVIERLAIFGEGLWKIMTGRFREGWEAMRSAFQGIGEEITEDWKAAGALADAEDALEDREIALIKTLEERRAKVAELRLLAKEEQDDQKKRLSLLNEAESIIRSVYGDEISLEKERLRIMQERLALQTKDPTDEQRREIAEQEAKINSLLREQAQELKGLARERNTVTKAVEAEFAALKKKNELDKISIENTKQLGKSLDLTSLRKSLISVGEETSALFQVMGQVAIDAASSVNGAFESLAVGMGEFFGQLATGDAGLNDFGRVIAGVFADMAINVGKIAIATGMAVLGIKKALATLNPWAAIAAGVALIAIGSAIKGALSRSAAGGGGGSTSAISSAGSSPAAATASTQQQKVTISLTGKLVAEGKDLVYVVDQENTRKKVST